MLALSTAGRSMDGPEERGDGLPGVGKGLSVRILTPKREREQAERRDAAAAQTAAKATAAKPSPRRRGSVQQRSSGWQHSSSARVCDSLTASCAYRIVCTKTHCVCVYVYF